MDGTVIIHGHADVVWKWRIQFKIVSSIIVSILEAALIASGRTDVKFEVSGYGEDIIALHLITMQRNVFTTVPVIIDIFQY
jgi:hypothetical protein